jgi:ARG and Rhodanese-Phosphatase-superfamily-associated Protein domain
MKYAWLALVLASVLVVVITFRVEGRRGRGKNVPPSPPPTGVALSGDDVEVGPAATFDNLTVFAITSRHQVDVGPMTTLDLALAKGDAEVREVGASANPPPTTPVGLQRQGYTGGGPRVNELVIENKGSTPIYVLAGTVVKGGNQDRQIGQDFIVEPNKTANVDAFCVEHGRWTGERNGRATGGKFGTMAQLTTSKIRAAAQYKKDQSEVWSNVDATNSAHGKSAPSHTLMATLDDPDVVRRREALAGRVTSHLQSIEPKDGVVGLAYAVDGKVRAVRWFASHQVFELARPSLVNTAAVDALTATAADPTPGGPKAAPGNTTASDVLAFVREVQDKAVQEERDTRAGNKNEYKESPNAYGSRTMLKSAPAASAAPVPLSSDFLAK